MTESFETISFRPLTLDDMPQMALWLSDHVIAEWYGEGGTSIEHLTAKYVPRIREEEATRGFVASIGDMDIGYIQAVPIDGYPDYAKQLQLEPGAVGIDMFVGAAEFRGRGVGSALLRAFTDQIVFGQMAAICAVIGPDPANMRAVRSYEKAGFVWLKTVHVTDDKHPYDSGEEYVMVRFAPCVEA